MLKQLKAFVSTDGIVIVARESLYQIISGETLMTAQPIESHNRIMRVSEYAITADCWQIEVPDEFITDKLPSVMSALRDLRVEGFRYLPDVPMLEIHRIEALGVTIRMYETNTDGKFGLQIVVKDMDNWHAMEIVTHSGHGVSVEMRDQNSTLHLIARTEVPQRVQRMVMSIFGQRYPRLKLAQPVSQIVSE